MNYLIVQHNHQNIQIRSQNIMLKKIPATVGVNAPLQIPYVPDIASITNSYRNSTSNITHPPTYERLHRNFPPKK